jgi:hypothetical protein
MAQRILSVLAGVIAAVIIFFIFEGVNGAFFPPKDSFDYKDPQQMKEYMKALPTAAFLLLLLGYVVGSVVCGIVVRKISKVENYRLAYIAGGLLTLAWVYNFMNIPHPVWVVVIGLLLFVPSVILGYRWGLKKAS